MELRSQRGANVGEIAAGVLRNEMRPPSSFQALMANFFSQTQGQLIFAFSLAGIALEIWTHVTKWSSGTKACVPDEDTVCCFKQHLSQHLSVGNKSQMMPWEGTHEDHYLFLVDSPGYHERARELSKGAGPLSIQKASKLGHAAESRGR